MKEELGKIVKEKLTKIGIVFVKCRKCDKDIIFLPTKNGKRMPVNCDLTSHFADCPYANDFRNNRNTDVVRYS